MSSIPSKLSDHGRSTQLNDSDRSAVFETSVTDTHKMDIHKQSISVPDMPMTYETLKRYLPHRYPFMLIDRVTECQPKTCITGYKNVSINEPFFQGHFPDVPIMPGVLIIEAMAQISGVLGFISEGLTAEDGYLYLFAGVDKVRFKRQVIPGDQLVLQANLVMQKRGIYKFDCQAYVQDTVAASAQVMIARQQKLL